MYYKFLQKGLRSDYDHSPWILGEWRTIEGELGLCRNGFHCSKTFLDALRYIRGEVFAEVEVRGDSKEEGDKSVHREMRVVKAWEWTKEDSVALTVYAAELVLPLFEQKHPGNTRPRKVIALTKKWLQNHRSVSRMELQDAANAANAEDAAYAANAAYVAAAVYADAVYTAVYAAAATAYIDTSAKVHFLEKINDFAMKIIAEKTEIE